MIAPMVRGGGLRTDGFETFYVLKCVRLPAWRFNLQPLSDIIIYSIEHKCGCLLVWVSVPTSARLNTRSRHEY